MRGLRDPARSPSTSTGDSRAWPWPSSGSPPTRSSSPPTAAACRSGHRACRRPAWRRRTSSPRSSSSCRERVDASFLAHLGPLADVIPIPAPAVQNVASVGDVLISLGLGFFLFATVVRTPARQAPRRRGGGRSRPGGPIPGVVGTARLHGVSPAALGVAGGIRPETGLVAGLAEASLLTHPVLLGRDSPALAGTGIGESTGRRGRRVPVPGSPSGSDAIRTSGSRSTRRSPRSGPAGVISLFGDRIHQVALALIVLRVTGSPIAVGFVFLAATLPNLLLGPISGTLVDRWDQKQVLVVCDLLRASIVMLIPIAVVTNVVLVYPARLPGHGGVALLPAGARGGDPADRPARTTCWPPTPRTG